MPDHLIVKEVHLGLELASLERFEGRSYEGSIRMVGHEDPPR
jgi:hypothetical protein